MWGGALVAMEGKGNSSTQRRRARARVRVRMVRVSIVRVLTSRMSSSSGCLLAHLKPFRLAHSSTRARGVGGREPFSLTHSSTRARGVGG